MNPIVSKRDLFVKLLGAAIFGGPIFFFGIKHLQAFWMSDEICQKENASPVTN